MAKDLDLDDVACGHYLAVEELAVLRKDALLGRFARLHLVELGAGWQLNQVFIPGAPSIEEVTDALDSSIIEAMLAR